MTTEEIKSMVESKLPGFVKAVKNKDAEMVVLDQLAFSENELELLGAAIKYAGYFNKTVMIGAGG